MVGGQIIILSILVALTAIVGGFLATQDGVLRALPPRARRLRPALVWLQLVPGFGQVWQFIVVCRIADSFRNEIEHRRADSFMGADYFRSAALLDIQPTRVEGLSFAIFNTLLSLLFLAELLLPGDSNGWVAAPFMISSLVAIICLIIYWTRLAAVRRIISSFTG